MPPAESSARPRIEVEGRQISDSAMQHLIHAAVDDDLSRPDMFTLRFRDPEHQIIDDTGLNIGRGVRIMAGRSGEDATELLISGEVTALEKESDQSGQYLLVRGYDHSHRLFRGRRTETYSDMTDSDIARRLAQAAGLRIGRIDDSRSTHPHVSRLNLTDWEFLKARAREIGYEVAVADGAFEFRRPTRSSDAPESGGIDATNRLQLVLGSNLEMFRGRVTSAEQVKDVEVRGWDPAAKRAVSATAGARTSSASIGLSPSELARMFGDPSHVSTERALATQAECEAAANAIAEQIGSSFAEAEGVARGDPRLRAGVAISVGRAGPPFDGRYVLTSTRHVFGPEGYRTHFVVSGRQERSLLGLTSLGSSNGATSAGGPPLYGVYPAIVTNSNDPDHRGRVKLQFPWLAPSYESNWARVAMVGAGSRRGLLVIPEVQDEVLVAFEHGDIRRPYVLGGLFNGRDDPPNLAGGAVDSGSGAVAHRAWVSRNGHNIVLSDRSSDDGILVETGNGSHSLSLSASGMKIELSSDGSISIEAAQELRLKGASVKIEADAAVEVSGTQIRLN